MLFDILTELQNCKVFLKKNICNFIKFVKRVNLTLIFLFNLE